MYKKFYDRVSKEEFREEIRKSQESGLPTEKFMLILYQIAHKTMRSHKYLHVTKDWQDDAISAAICKLAMSFNKFDLGKHNEETQNTTSPYSYYTTAVVRCFYNEWGKQYHFFDLKRLLYQWTSSITSAEVGVDPYFDEYYEGSNFADNELDNFDDDTEKTKKFIDKKEKLFMMVDELSSTGILEDEDCVDELTEEILTNFNDDSGDDDELF